MTKLKNASYVSTFTSSNGARYYYFKTPKCNITIMKPHRKSDYEIVISGTDSNVFFNEYLPTSEMVRNWIDKTLEENQLGGNYGNLSN